jgi:hypothetical protein
VLAACAVAALVVATAFGMLRSEEPAVTAAPEPPVTAPTTTTSTTTTEAPPALPAGTVEVATVKEWIPLIEVRSGQPEDWDSTPPAISQAATDLPPWSAATMPERPALPRTDYPVVGRYAVESGWQFENPGPYDPPQPFTMLVTERRGDWAKVLVPVRPNGTEGWVRLSDVDISTTSHRIEVRLSERTLRAYAGDELLAETPVVIGASGSQTPTGVFYVTDKVPQSNPGGAYGPVALATDGYSEMMDTFDTGVPVVAIHGTNRPDLLGRPVSNGCIRVPNDIIVRLAEALPQGTPVYIWP